MILIDFGDCSINPMENYSISYGIELEQLNMILKQIWKDLNIYNQSI